MLAHKLAQGLLYLYFINWLYKVLCSSNILFFPSLSITALDIRFPLITGFDNSRRSRFNKAMNKVPCTGYMEIFSDFIFPELCVSREWACLAHI